MREFWTLPLKELTPNEWESLCDGCAKCCYVYDTDAKERTHKPCRLLNEQSKRCRGYSGRLWDVDGRDGYQCLPITVSLIESGGLPASCAYVRRHNGDSLESWQIERAMKNGNRG